jgi:hypothetical protein
MPKFNSKNSTRRSQSPVTTPTIEHYFQQQHPSSRSSSPKSFSVNSDHGFGSECASHLSSSRNFNFLNFFFYKNKTKGSPNAPNGYTYKRKRLYAAAPGRKCMCIKSYRTNLPGELLLNKGDIVESRCEN